MNKVDGLVLKQEGRRQGGGHAQLVFQASNLHSCPYSRRIGLAVDGVFLRIDSSAREKVIISATSKINPLPKEQLIPLIHKPLENGSKTKKPK